MLLVRLRVLLINSIFFFYYFTLAQTGIPQRNKLCPVWIIILFGKEQRLPNSIYFTFILWGLLYLYTTYLAYD